ncbi:dnaJ homolog subfamily C member 8-like [Halichondria panicea]|uniref:dnaJ homolog subfamily C member 8-like n=1 Tax=Halichondria panicea TaxID=6063 RepID=UPI00312B56CE
MRITVQSTFITNYTKFKKRKMQKVKMATGGEGSSGENTFTEFMNEVKAIEKRDSVLTSVQQIDRLLRPGSKYSNLNPYNVLMIDADLTLDKIKKTYRKLSFLVHPDKNPDDKDRAQLAFDAVSKAYEMFNDEEKYAYCKGVIEEAEALVEHKLEEKRALAKKSGKITIEEDDPEKCKTFFNNTLTKLFVDLDLKKKAMEERDIHERKRKREEVDEIKEKAKKEKEWKEQWEETRTKRVDSWRSFQDSKTKKKKKGKGLSTGLKPPKLKLEKK